MTENIERRAQQPTADEKNGHSSKSGMMMWACCIAMVGGGAVFLFSSGTSGLNSIGLTALLPIGLCVGMHFVMHRMMGRSCHGDQAKHEITSAEDQTGAIPGRERQ